MTIQAHTFVITKPVGKPRTSRFDPTLPEKIVGLQFVSRTATSLTFGWTADSDATTYNVYVNAEPTPRMTGVTGTQTTLTGLSDSSTYQVSVTGENGAGEGPPSDKVTMSTEATVSGEVIYPYEPIPTTNVYYVSPNGSSGNSGTNASPWSLAHAVSVVNPGDTIVLKNGVYLNTSANQDAFTLTRAGTSANRIRFVAETKWGAVCDRQYNGTIQSSTFFRINCSGYITLEGLEIKRCRSGAINANWTGGLTQEVILRHCHIHDNGNHDSAEFNVRTGLYCGVRSRYWIVESCLIHSNGRLPSPDISDNQNYAHDHGWYAQGHGHIARNNIFFDHTAGWDIKVDCLARNVDGTNFVFPANERAFTCINNTFASFRAPPRSPGQVRFYRNTGGNPPINVLIANNVSWNAASHFIHTHLGGWPWPGAEIVGNITTASAITNADSSVFNCGASCEYRVLSGNVVNANSPDATLGMASPASFDAVEGDFRLRSTASMLIDQATASYNPNRDGLATVFAPTRDYDNKARPKGGGYDLGAFEYGD